MAQRRNRMAGGMGRAARRMGLTGGRLAAIGLVVLACAGGAIGVAAQSSATGFTVTRAQVEDAALVDGSDGLVSADDGGTEPEETSSYIVHVDGAVLQPGVVELEGADVRVADAVDAAGGLADDADTSNVNLAEPLVDGAKIHIPTVGEGAGQDTAAAPAGQGASSGAATQTGVGGTGLININTATAEELQQLRGIGEVTAQAIVDDRERNGPFSSPEDVMRVSGIGEKKFESMRESICV